MVKKLIAEALEGIGRTCRGTGTGPTLALAFVLGAGLAYGTALGQGTSTANPNSGPPDFVQLPPDAKGPLNGDKVALVRVVKKGDQPDDYRVATYYNGEKPNRHESPQGVSFDIAGADDPSQPNIRVEAVIPKSLLNASGQPIEVVTTGVVIKVGTDTTIWDCYWRNGTRYCEEVEV